MAKVTLADTSIANPALVDFNSRLCLAWAGTDSTHKLNISSSADGQHFSTKVTLADTSSSGPALAVFNGRLYLAWTGADSTHKLNISSSADGQHFSTKVTLADTSSSGPVLAVFNGRLYLAWAGTDSSHHLNIISSADGQHFSTKVTLADTSSSGPALAVFNGRLYLAWAGTDSSHHLNIISSADGASFGNKATFAEMSASGPSLVNAGGGLWLAWPSAGTRQLNFQRIDPPASLSAPKLTLADTSIAAIGLSSSRYAAWTGTDSSHHLNIVDMPRVTDSVTPLLSSGPPGTKKNVVVLGDGFAEQDQTTYNSKVQELLIDGVFGHDYFYEDKQAFNIYRVNLISHDSGVSERTYDEKGTPDDGSDDTIVRTIVRDTALGFIFNGSWAHCWLESGPDTWTRVQNALDTWAPDHDLIVILLNNPNYGGCGGGGLQIVPLGVDWHVLAHEFGHGTGGLADEYCTSNAYGGGEPGMVNASIATDRAALKWGRFVAPTTPLPTGSGPCAGYTASQRPSGWSDSQDVGLFEGGNTCETGVYRPALDCRMRDNITPFCPVCYTELKTRLDPYAGRSFLECYSGDFDGDGRDDVLVHNGNAIQVYRSNGAQLDLAFDAVGQLAGGWQLAPNDQFVIADFNGDGKAEVLIYNSVDWSQESLGLLADDGQQGLRLIARYTDALAGWQFNRNDRFLAGDFNGDGKADLYVFNGGDLPVPYLGMLQSSGSGFSLVQRYESSLPSWQMKPNDRFMVGDFDGDGKDDLYVFNGSDWSVAYLAMLRSDGAQLTLAGRFNQNLPGWPMKPKDQYFVGDFDGDGKDDLYVFNGSDWSVAYLGLLQSSGSALSTVTRYEGNAPGWQLRKNDRFYVGDVNGDGKADLFAFNTQDWAHRYLGALISNGSTLSASASEDSVGEWSLGAADQLIPCNFEGLSGRRNLFVHNQDWFGMIRATPALELQRLYYRWIHSYRYGRNW